MSVIRDPLQPGDWIAVCYELDEGELKELQGQFIEYRIWMEGEAGMGFVLIRDDIQQIAGINLETIKTIRKVGPRR